MYLLLDLCGNLFQLGCKAQFFGIAGNAALPSNGIADGRNFPYLLKEHFPVLGESDKLRMFGAGQV